MIGTSGNDTISVGAGSNSITGGGGGDQVTLPVSHSADTFAYSAITDSFSNVLPTVGGGAQDSNTDVISNFIAGASHDVIDVSQLSGGATQTFNAGGSGTVSTLQAAFGSDAANEVNFAVIGGNTFIHTATHAGYSVGDLLIELQGTPALTAANVHLHP